MPPSLPSELTTELFDAYNTDLQTSGLKATRNAAMLPPDLAFYRSLDRGIAKGLDASSSRVLGLANRLLDLVATADTSKSRSKGKGRLEQDDVTDNFRSAVVDSMDQLLERADICMDEFLGLIKQPVIDVNPKLAKPKKNATPSGRLDPAIQHASHISKPQLTFKRKVDNSDLAPWHPSLRHKYNAKVPLGYNMQEESDMDGSNSHRHPYYHEIRNISYPSHMFISTEPRAPKSFEDTPFTWVADPATFAMMLEKLRGAKEIAIDLEYHSYRSFYGFVCLMQISTREEDWIVDTLKLREELEELNEVFTNPEIVKVLHGAESDIIWLQQDFNLYIVNLFDTYHASKVLDFPRHGLATLMEMYCDFIPDKRYQLADWRIRPLTEEMQDYARSDTHFLLFIYDNLRNALLDRAQSRSQSPVPSTSTSSTSTNPAHTFVREVLSRSAETSLRVFERETYDSTGAGPGGWDTLARKWNKGALMADARESAARRVYRAVHAWRDRVARAEDESARYVLQNQYLFVLAENPPADVAALLSVFQYVPGVVRRRVKELLDEIRKAVKDAAEASAVVQPVVEEQAMEVDESAAEPTPQDTTSQVATLWPAGPSRLAAQSSALFGAALAPTAASQSCAASGSTLFAGARPSADKQRLRFREVVNKIHTTLSITPRAPTPTLSAVRPAPVEQEPADDVPGVVGQAEVAFVPAAERAKTKVVVEDSVADAIVVVGQGQRKKRKRTAAVKVEATMEGETPEAFDYAEVGNILDEGSDHEPEVGPGGKKRRQKGQARVDYGNFRAPPKAHSEVKSGNMSRTFK